VRETANQRPSGDADREARLPEPDRQAPLPDPCGRVLRVDGRKRPEEAPDALIRTQQTATAGRTEARSSWSACRGKDIRLWKKSHPTRVS